MALAQEGTGSLPAFARDWVWVTQTKPPQMTMLAPWLEGAGVQVEV